MALLMYLPLLLCLTPAAYWAFQILLWADQLEEPPRSRYERQPPGLLRRLFPWSVLGAPVVVLYLLVAIPTLTSVSQCQHSAGDYNTCPLFYFLLLLPSSSLMLSMGSSTGQQMMALLIAAVVWNTLVFYYLAVLVGKMFGEGFGSLFGERPRSGDSRAAAINDEHWRNQSWWR